MLTARECRDCGNLFFRASDEVWKTRCLSCYAIRKARRPIVPKPVRDPIADELRDRLRALVNLCHPDRHGGSKLSTETTAWLLSVRERIEPAKVTQ